MGVESTQTFGRRTMPLVTLQYKAGRQLKELAENLAEALPEIVAPNLTLPEREQLDGQVTPDDIVVRCTESGTSDINTKDLEIIIWAHEFPERLKNLEERKEAIIRGVWTFLADYDRNVSGFVWVLLQPTAFGQL